MLVEELVALLKRDLKKMPLEEEEIDYVISSWEKKQTPLPTEIVPFKPTKEEQAREPGIPLVEHEKLVSALELANRAIEELKEQLKVCKTQMEASNANAVRWTKQKDEIASKYHGLNKEHERLKAVYAALEKKNLEIERGKNK